MSGCDGVGERCVRGWRGSISVANVYKCCSNVHCQLYYDVYWKHAKERQPVTINTN